MSDPTENYDKEPDRSRKAKWVTHNIYPYADQGGHTVFEVHRQRAQFGANQPDLDAVTGKPKKRCFQRWLTTADGKKPKDAPVLPYQLPALIAGVAAGRTVYLAEGEPKVDQLRSWGLVATCNDGGAGKWRKEHAEFLRGADVVILPDNDAPGRVHSDKVGSSLRGVAARVRLVELPNLPEHGDIIDWVRAGGTREHLAELVTAAPDWTPYGAAPGEQVEVILKVGKAQLAVDESITVLAQTGLVYRRGVDLVKFVIEAADATKGRPTAVIRLRKYIRPMMKLEMLRHIQFKKHILKGKGKGKDEILIDIPLPDDIVEMVRTSASTVIPELVGIIETPTLRPDGTVLCEEGYDPATGLILVGPPEMPEVPEEPTWDEAESALRTLNDLLVEFPFVDDASRSVALSMLMVPVVRAALAHAPLHAAVAPEAGTGKSFLIDLASTIATGRPAPVLSIPTDRNRLDRGEFDKRLTAALFCGQPLIFIDNVNGTLASDLLASALTQSNVSIRKFGTNDDMVTVKSMATIFANGNNMEIEADLVRRTIRCKLDAQMERPQEREFKGNPQALVLADRGKYIAAILTIVRAHLAAGCPGAASLRPLGGFNDYTRLVRGALVWLGKADPVTTQEELNAVDPRGTQLDDVLRAWKEGVDDGSIPSGWRTIRDLTVPAFGPLTQALRELTGVTRNDDPVSPAKAGMHMKWMVRQVRGRYRINNRKNHNENSMEWRLERQGEDKTWVAYLKLDQADKVVPIRRPEF